MNEKINIWQYWQGERPPAVLRLEKTVENLYTEEAGYSYHRLTDADIPDEVKELFKTCRRENVADVLRYWLAYEKGGIWFDSDVACRKRIDFHSLLQNPEVAISANVRRPGTIWASTCIIGSNKGCFLFKKLYEQSLDIMTRRGRNTGYADVGPLLATRILAHHRGKWKVLPWCGWRHQFCADQMKKYRDVTDSFKYEHDIYGRDWSYAHFCGHNVRWWDAAGMPEGCVMGDTVRRCEDEIKALSNEV